MEKWRKLNLQKRTNLKFKFLSFLNFYIEIILNSHRCKKEGTENLVVFNSIFFNGKILWECSIISIPKSWYWCKPLIIWFVRFYCLWMLALCKCITHSIVYLSQHLIYRALNLHKNVLFCLFLIIPTFSSTSTLPSPTSYWPLICSPTL